MPQMRSVFSSHIESIGHDPETNELHVKYQNGRTSIYEGVPADLADTVSNSESVGSAIHQMIKGQYGHRYA